MTGIKKNKLKFTTVKKNVTLILVNIINITM